MKAKIPNQLVHTVGCVTNSLVKWYHNTDIIIQRFKTCRFGFSNFLLEECPVLHPSVPQSFHFVQQHHRIWSRCRLCWKEWQRFKSLRNRIQGRVCNTMRQVTVWLWRWAHFMPSRRKYRGLHNIIRLTYWLRTPTTADNNQSHNSRKEHNQRERGHCATYLDGSECLIYRFDWQSVATIICLAGKVRSNLRCVYRK